MTKIIKEFTYKVEDKSGKIITVCARIEKESNYYCWYTSHLTKPQDSDRIGLYRPSNQESTIEEAKAFLNSYISMMKRSKVVLPNEYY